MITYTQQEINNFYSKYSCCFASLATDYTNSLAIGAFDCGQKLDKLLQFKSYLDILNCYKVDTCIINQPEVAAGISSWYFGIGSFTGTISYYLIIDGSPTLIGLGTNVTDIVTSINNNTEGTGVSAVLGSGGYFTIYSPEGCFVKTDLYGVKDPVGTIPASVITFTAGRCPKEENCEQYTEEQLNCISNENLDSILFWLKQTCLTVKNKPIISEIECTSSEDEYTFQVNQTVIIQAGDSIEVERNGNTYTITNPLPDQQVTITAGSNITVTGNYPNFTISSTGSGSSTTLMIDLTNAELITALTNATITKGVIYRVTDATGGIVQVIGRGTNSVTKAAYREGKSDTTLTQVMGIYGTYTPSTNIFIEQGRIATQPTVNEDAARGYYVGQELKTLDTGITYKCTDSSNGAAVWTAISIAPTYQEVLDAGNTSTTESQITDGTNSVTVQSNQIKIANAVGYGTIDATNLTSAVAFKLPNKGSSPQTFAMLSDVTSSSTDLGYSASSTDGEITSSTGTSAIVPLADSTNAGLLKPSKFTVLENTTNTNSGDETAATIGAIVNGATNYTTPLDADKIGIWDTLNSLFKSVTWANIKTTLKTYFDTLYQTTLVSGTNIKTINSTSLLGSGNIVITGSSDPIASCSNGTAVTGTLLNTFSKALPIPAGTRVADQAPQVDANVEKTGTAGNINVRLYWNTTPDIAGTPILLGLMTAGATTRVQPISRILAIEVANGTGNGTKIVPTGIASATQWASFTSPMTSAAIDWTAAGYLVVAMSNGNAGDSSVCNMIKLH